MDEKLVLTYYKTGTLLIQGKHLLLFSEIVYYCNELLEEEQIYGTLNRFLQS